jgi:hypothetical protein
MMNANIGSLHDGGGIIGCLVVGGKCSVEGNPRGCHKRQRYMEERENPHTQRRRVGKFIGQEFEGDEAIEAGVLSHINNAHAAPPSFSRMR